MPETSEKNAAFDSGQQHLAKVYAKALLGAVIKSGHAERILNELNGVIDDVLAKLPKLETVLTSPRIGVDVKLGMLNRAFGGKVSTELLRFLKVVCEHGRLDCLRAIRNAAWTQFNELAGRVDVQIRTAELMPADLQARVAGHLSAVLGKTVHLHPEVDAAVLGGMVVRVGDTVYDASVANRLNRLREEAFIKTAQAIKQSLNRFETTGEGDHEV